MATVASFVVVFVGFLESFLNLKDRWQGRFPKVDQQKLYEEALTELESERDHVDALVEATDPEFLKTKYQAIYPYIDIKKESKRLKDFKKNRLFSRHFWKYGLIAAKVYRLSSETLTEAEARNFGRAKSLASELAPVLDELMKRLKQDQDS